MSKRIHVLVVVWLMAAASGCGSSEPSSQTDLTTLSDQTATDRAGSVDVPGKDQRRADSANGDAFQPLGGFGTISGLCNVLDDGEWSSKSPFFFRNAIDFGTATYDPKLFSAEAQQILDEGTRGGSSGESEALAFEMVRRCELAKLVKSEKLIDYIDANGKKTDILVEIDGRKIGVSVVRPYHYPPSNPYTEAEALIIIKRKLEEMPLSQKNAKPENAWERSVLSAIAYNSQYADVVKSVWDNQISAETKGDAILLLTVTDGNDGFLYNL